jgi:hypothetical protein
MRYDEARQPRSQDGEPRSERIACLAGERPVERGRVAGRSETGEVAPVATNTSGFAFRLEAALSPVARRRAPSSFLNLG